jgi:hypothetical protein
MRGIKEAILKEISCNPKKVLVNQRGNRRSVGNGEGFPPLRYIHILSAIKTNVSEVACHQKESLLHKKYAAINPSTRRRFVSNTKAVKGNVSKM